jgi:hypothetical protein
MAHPGVTESSKRFSIRTEQKYPSLFILHDSKFKNNEIIFFY